MSMLEFQVTVTWHTAEDGSDIILSTDLEIGEEEARWRNAIDTLKAKIDTGEDAGIIQPQISQIEEILQSFSTLREHRESLRPYAQTMTLTIRKPTLTEVEDALAASESFDEESGERSFDDVKYRRSLMPKCITLDEPIPAAIETYIWNRIKKASKGDTARMPFLSLWCMNGKRDK